MIERVPFTTDNVGKINDLVQEGLREIEKNFADESYPPDKQRELILRIVFEPSKADPTEISAVLFKAVKFPKRYGKLVNSVIREGRIFVEKGPEQETIPRNVFPLKENER
jgi:hypothetical protein